MTLCPIGSAVAESLAQHAEEGAKLPWHMTAAGLLTATWAFGGITRSLTAPPLAIDPLSPDALRGKVTLTTEGKQVSP